MRSDREPTSFRIAYSVLRKCRRDGRDSIALFARKVSVANGIHINFERAKSRLVAFSRVWSRLVAPIFFSCPGTFGRVLAYLVIWCRILSSFFVISRHSSSFFVPKKNFRVWRATGGCGNGWAGRAAVCCAWLPRQAPDVHRVMISDLNWYATAAGPRLRSFMFRTIVLQNRGACISWECQRASQNGDGFLSCSEGQGCQQLSELETMQLK